VAGTDRNREIITGGRRSFLVEPPNWARNIGNGGRAMANFGLSNLRIVIARWLAQMTRPSVAARNADHCESKGVVVFETL